MSSDEVCGGLNGVPITSCIAALTPMGGHLEVGPLGGGGGSRALSLPREVPGETAVSGKRALPGDLAAPTPDLGLPASGLRGNKFRVLSPRSVVSCCGLRLDI